MKIRIKFRKYGIMKFIGHLDIMRYFQKVMTPAIADATAITTFRIISHTDFLIAIIPHLLS